MAVVEVLTSGRTKDNILARAFFILYALPTDMFKDQKMQMFVKSLQINRSLILKTTPVFFQLKCFET